MAKKTIDKDINTAFHKKVMHDLKDRGYSQVTPESVAFILENTSDDVIVDINYMSSGLHYNKKDIIEQDVIEAGFKYCFTWNFYEK